MDLRFNYDHIRRQIDEADIAGLDPKSLLVRDIKRRMHQEIDAIEELEEQKKNIEVAIQLHRMALKKEAERWEI